MAGTILTDGEDESHVERPVRRPKPTTTLLQSEEPALPFQQKAIQAFLAAEATKHATGRQLAIGAVQTNQTKTSSLSQATSTESIPSVVPVACVPSTLSIIDVNKRAHAEEIIDEESGDEERENACINPKRESTNPPG
jgi:hypothetical protein